MILVAGIFIRQVNKYLLVQEKNPRAYGKWNLPAGHVDNGESLQDAAKREGKEETGLDIEVGKELLVFTGETADHEVHIFEGKVIGGQITWNQEELLDVRWFTKEEIKGLNLRSENYRQLFQ